MSPMGLGTRRSTWPVLTVRTRWSASSLITAPTWASPTTRASPHCTLLPPPHMERSVWSSWSTMGRMSTYRYGSGTSALHEPTQLLHLCTEHRFYSFSSAASSMTFSWSWSPTHWSRARYMYWLMLILLQALTGQCVSCNKKPWNL